MALRVFLKVDPSKNNIYENFVSVSTRGSIRKCFYQEALTIIFNGVAVLSNGYLNKYNELFIVTVWRNTIEQTLWHRWNIKSRFKTQQINLPVDQAGEVGYKKSRKENLYLEQGKSKILY